MLNSIAAVFWFEWHRALTFPRLAWWGLFALFPSFIMGLIRFTATRPPEIPELWTVILFALVPMLVSMLGTFLWATPAVSSELEGNSWVYLAVRPNGATAVLLGKYLATVAWVLSAALVGLLLAVLLMPADGGARIGGVIARLTFLSCPAYAALYLLLGTLFPKRSMVVAVAYTLVFELVVGMVPAVINTLTVQYRVRTLLSLWGDISFQGTNTPHLSFVGDPPAWEHVLILIAYTLVLLITAVGVVRISEFRTSDGGDA